MTIFLSPKIAEATINSYFNYNHKIIFTTIYFSDNLLKYQRYIEGGGTYNIQIYDDDDSTLQESKTFLNENIIKRYKVLQNIHNNRLIREE